MTSAAPTTRPSSKAGARPVRRILAFLVFLACVLSTAALTASPASAASRGFTVTNNSTETLRLEGVHRVNHSVCAYFGCVGKVNYPIDFEGRPETGAELAPAETQRFELKYAFNPSLNQIQYAAKLTYKIEHSNAQVEYVIDTTPTSNNSSCAVIPASAGTCTAGGLGLTFSS